MKKMAPAMARHVVMALAVVVAGCGGSGGGDSKTNPPVTTPPVTTPPVTTPPVTTPPVTTPPVASTVQAIDTSDRAAVLALYNTTMLPSFSVPMQWTGAVAGCKAGTTSADWKAAVVRTVNSFRVLAGLPGNITLNLAHSAMAQQGALMMEANSALNHEPPATWTCYTEEGKTAAGSANLALGNAGPSAVHAYMADNGTPSLGHRRWVLSSRLGEIGTGDTTRSNVLWVFGGTVAAPASATTAGIPWPPRGFVPWTNKVADPTQPWSFSLPGADFSAASVAVTNDQGQVLALSNVGQLAGGYGDNTMSWKLAAATPLWSRSPADTKFTVQLNNVLVDGKARSFQYSVTFFIP